MDYFLKITTPAGTKETQPLISTVELTKGTLISGEIIFSEGCNCYHHVAFYISTFRLAPFNRDQNYVGDNCQLNIFFDQDLHKQPHRLTILTWNDDQQSSQYVLVSLHLDPFAKPRSNKSFEQLTKELVPGYKKGSERNAIPNENTEAFYKS